MTNKQTSLTEHLRKIAHKGGNALLEKYGTDHFRKMGSRPRKRRAGKTAVAK